MKADMKADMKAGTKADMKAGMKKASDVLVTPRDMMRSE